MQWATGQTFEILAIGNGEFMHRVFLALSMLWSSGMFASLGAIGLLVGLIGLGPQSVIAGGQRMDIGSLFLGFILWLLFFAGGATVQVQEVGYSRPGSTLPGTWVVDNVPFGVAATGWLVSNVGKRVTEKMEQAYGLVDEEQSVLKTGHGRTLEWATSSPPPQYNFAFTPVVHEIDAWWDMKKHSYQRPTAGFKAVHMPKNTATGVVISALSLVLGFALIWHMWPLTIASFAAIVLAAIVHTFNYQRDYHIPAHEVSAVEARRTEQLAQSA